MREVGMLTSIDLSENNTVIYSDLERVRWFINLVQTNSRVPADLLSQVHLQHADQARRQKLYSLRSNDILQGLADCQG